MGMVKKLFLLVFVMCSISISYARTGIVEVANFYCPHCYASEKYTIKLRKELEKDGRSFVFVPWFVDQKSENSSKIYLSANKDVQNKMRSVLFTAANVGADFSTEFKACTSVNMFMPEYKTKTCVNSLTNGKAIKILKKTLKLLKIAYGGQLNNIVFPVFIVIKNNKVVGKMSYSDAGLETIMTNLTNMLME